MAHQYIFTMQNLRRVHPPNKEVLKGIYLSFYPGAKIGVLGVQRRRQVDAAADHGRRRQGLLRRGQAGRRDHDRLPAAGAGARSDEERARERREAVADTKGLLTRFDEVNAQARRGPRSRTRWTSCSTSRASCRTRSRPPTPGTSTARSRSRWTRCGCRPPTPTSTKLSGGERRRVALCQRAARAPDLLLLDEPTNHLDAESVAWLEHHLHEYPGTVVAVTHDRYFLDNVAGWILELDRGAGHPLGGQLLVVAGAEAEAARAARRRRSRRGSGRWPASSSGCAPRRARGRPSPRPASPPTRSCWPRSSRSARTTIEISIPPGPRLGDVVVKAEHLRKALRRQRADRGPDLQPAARRHRRRHRRQRRRQDHAVPHDRPGRRSPTAARCASATP